MKAITLQRLGEVAVEQREEPRLIEPGDAIVKVTTAAICGSDLHIVSGRDAGVRLGTIMGHEFVGVIEELGSEVEGLTSGDRVVAPFTVSCGCCFFCRRELPARCLDSQGFGFVTGAGRGLQGAQAEWVRVPLAASSLMKIPEAHTDGTALLDEQALFLGDIFSTAYSCAEKARIQPGDGVVVIGCGPVGLLCILAARLLGAGTVVALDTVEYRLEKARAFGALTAAPDLAPAAVLLAELTEGRGADAALEAVGAPAALDLALALVRPGAVVSIAGYHTEPSYALPIQGAYGKNLTLTIGRCNARAYMPRLLPLVLEKQVRLTEIISHVLPLSEAAHGYHIFANRLDRAIKVLLKP
jgi:threonine dehydrogenase-like Zn-dependent dehydrogenase